MVLNILLPFRAPEELLLLKFLLLKALLTKRTEEKVDIGTKKEITIKIALHVYILYPTQVACS